MGRYRRLPYARYARRGFALGVALFVAGTLGHALGPELFDPLPAWEPTLFTALEAGGIAIAFCAPIVFAVALPLIE